MRPDHFTRAAAFAAVMLGIGVPHALADETCNSPYMWN
jgi:hypothetical protein